MAELTKGDPRWIVEDREDGANCNNWHWTERDILPWAKQQVQEILANNDIEKGGKVELRTTEVSNIEGDCIIMNRKKKLICSFDLKMDVSWEGKVFDDDRNELCSVKGKMIVPDVDDTTLGDDMVVDVTCAEAGDAADLVLDVVRKQGRKFVRKGMEEFALILKDVHNVTNKTQSKVSDAKSPTAKQEQSKTAEGRPTDKVSIKLDWRVPPAELWDVLTNPAKASAYTRSNVTHQVVEGGDFSFLGGSISGKFTSVDAPKGYSMTWRLDNWDPGHFSNVTISLDSHEAGATEMHLSQENIPNGEASRVKEGWNRNFFEPIKGLFGYMYSTR